jgi:hypothetical protein
LGSEANIYDNSSPLVLVLHSSSQTGAGKTGLSVQSVLGAFLTKSVDGSLCCIVSQRPSLLLLSFIFKTSP